MIDRVFNIPAWDRRARCRSSGDSRSRGGTRRAASGRNPLRAEIRVEAAGEFVRSEAGRDPLALIDVAMTWKAQFQEKGWA